MLELMATDLAFYWPQAFPFESITYKMHIAFTHIHQYARLNAHRGRSPGMDTEQGVESLHKFIAALVARQKSQKKAARGLGLFNELQWRCAVRTEVFDSCTRVCPGCKNPNSKSYDVHCTCIKIVAD